MSASHSQKVALITGAGGGIGRETAKDLLSDGWTLVITDIDEANLEETRSQLGTASCLAVAGDITSETFISSLVAHAIDRFGQLNAVINNAGVIGGAPIEFATSSDWDRIFGVNAKSQFLLIKACVSDLKKSPGASVVNISSIAGQVAFPNMPVYCASKAAVIGLTLALARDLADSGIRVNAICPGSIDTPMPHRYLAELPEDKRELGREAIVSRQLIKRQGRPGEISALIAFLVSDRASFMTGQVVNADGGWSAW
jgi:NAD(P)-dependent dehydrogenase (short-subunit alcohol dehydrogenase family)